MLWGSEGRGAGSWRTGGQRACWGGAGLGGAVLSGVRGSWAARVSEEGVRSIWPESHVGRQAQRVAGRGTNSPLGSDAAYKRTAVSGGEEA